MPAINRPASISRGPPPCRPKEEAVVLMYGFDDWSDGQFVSLDVNRSRLETGAFLLFWTGLRTAGRLLDNAPNIRSYIGSNLFTLVRNISSMGPRGVADRLNQLRIHSGLSDTQVLNGAASGELPAEPHFAEWLVSREKRTCPLSFGIEPRRRMLWRRELKLILVVLTCRYRPSVSGKSDSIYRG